MKISLRPGLACEDGRLVEHVSGGLRIDCDGLDILPGLIDLHGDAFERAIQPRPGVTIPMDIAIRELESALLAAGITTAYLAVTLSWEAGLRSRATYEALRDALAARPANAAPDLRLHVRFEAQNLDCLDLAVADIEAGHIKMLSFNDHTPAIIRKLPDRAATAKYTDRATQSYDEFAASARRAAAAPADAAAAGRARLAAAARAAGIPMASHDDASIEARDEYRALGARISEFPMAPDIARHATQAGEAVVMGAPNVVRGGSHIGWHGAEALVREKLCTILCSDYHYPSMLAAIYRLTANRSASFDAACALATANPAAATNLPDRGTLTAGQRADLILIAPHPTPHVIATISAGRLAYLTAEAATRLTIP